MKTLKCGGRTYRVNDEAYCKNGEVAKASAKTLVSESQTLAQKTNFSKGRKAADSTEKSYAEKGMEIVKGWFD